MAGNADITLRVAILEQDLAKMREQLSSGSIPPVKVPVQFDKGSLGAIKQEIAALNKEIDGLGNKTSIAAKQKEIAALEKQAASLTGTSKGLSGIFDSIGGGGMLKSIGAMGAGMMAISAATSLATMALEGFVAKDAALADLSAMTGATGDKLKQLGDDATELSNKFGSSLTDNVAAAKIVLSKLGPEVANDTKALKSMEETINVLSKTSPKLKDTAVTAGVLANVTNAMGLSTASAADKATFFARAANVLAAAAKEGAIEADQVGEAMLKAGGVMESSNVSFEEGAALVEILGQKFAGGSENGDKLRAVMLRLQQGRFMPKDTAEELQKAGVNLAALTNSSASATDRLRALKPVAGDNALLAKLFGEEAFIAAQHIIKNVDAVDKMKKSITGTNEALDQANIQMSTYQSSWDRFANRIKNGAAGVLDAMKENIASNFQMLYDVSVLGIYDKLMNAGEAKQKALLQKYKANMAKDAADLKAQNEKDRGVAVPVPDAVVLPAANHSKKAMEDEIKKETEILDNIDKVAKAKEYARQETHVNALKKLFERLYGDKKKGNEETLKDLLATIDGDEKYEEERLKLKKESDKVILESTLEHEKAKLLVMERYKAAKDEVDKQRGVVELTQLRLTNAKMEQYAAGSLKFLEAQLSKVKEKLDTLPPMSSEFIEAAKEGARLEESIRRLKAAQDMFTNKKKNDDIIFFGGNWIQKKPLDEFLKEVKKAKEDGEKAAAEMGESIGSSIAQGISSGQPVLHAVLKSVLQTIGDFLIGKATAAVASWIFDSILELGPIGATLAAGVGAGVVNGILKTALGVLTGFETGGIILREGNQPEIIAPAREYSEFMDVMVREMRGFAQNAIAKLNAADVSQREQSVAARFVADPVDFHLRGNDLYASLEQTAVIERRRALGTT